MKQRKITKHYACMLLLLWLFLGYSGQLFATLSQAPSTHTQLMARLSTLESASKGRLGVYALNTATHQHIAYHADQRFPMCSTSKLLVIAAILKQSERNKSLLNTRIHYKRRDLIAWSPTTKKHWRRGLSIASLCKAAITQSDNTAVNLLIKQLGGIKAVNAFARSIGDVTFNLKHNEPGLNAATPGDTRDTTTPMAMGKSLYRLVLSDVLAPRQRALLKHWLLTNTTGDRRIRDGVPTHWQVGDKTGTCRFGTTNDIGIVWLAHGKPIVLSLYFTQKRKYARPREALLAKVTHLVVRYFASVQN